MRGKRRKEKGLNRTHQSSSGIARVKKMGSMRTNKGIDFTLWVGGRVKWVDVSPWNREVMKWRKLRDCMTPPTSSS